MPTFDFTSPEGKTYSVEGPEGATSAQAFEILQTQLGGATKPAEASGPSIGSDLAGVVKAAPGRMVAGLAGIPGDLLHLGMRALGDNLTRESAFGSNAINKALGSDYEAKTETGRVAQKVGDFLPAVIGGPETLAVKALTRVAAPVAASEAGRAVGGPVGEVAGALAGAAGAGSVAQRFNAAAKARGAVPSGEELVRRGSDQFDQARAMDLSVKSEFAKKTGQDMRAAVEGYDPEQIKPVLNAIDRVEALYQPEKRNLYNALNVDRAAVPVPMNEVELARKQLSSLRTSNDASIRSAAKEAQEAITKNQMRLTAADTVSGDATLYSQTIRNAVGNYGAGKRSAAVTGKADLASLNAGTAGSGANEDNALRQAIKQLARPINNTNTPVAKRLGFNDSEIAAIKNAATGTITGNTARYLGKLAPTGSVSGFLSAGAGYGAAGPLGAVALPAVGYLAKKIGDLSTKKAVEALDSLVRSRSPLAQQVAAQLPPAIVQKLPPTTKLLLGSSALRPITMMQQPVPQPVPQGSY